MKKRLSGTGPSIGPGRNGEREGRIHRVGSTPL
jgi:hypothetical protein